MAFLGKESIMRMTGEFEDFKSEIVARLAEHLILSCSRRRLKLSFKILKGVDLTDY